MKSLLFFFSIAMPAGVVFAQGVFSNQTNLILEKVIQDYPNHFGNIKGGLLSQDPNAVNYSSNVAIPGSVSCSITQYGPAAKPAYRWQATIFETVGFAEASNRYSQVYNEIRNTIIKSGGEKPFILTGDYEPPSEERKSITTLFNLLPSKGEMETVKIGLSMNYETKWQIILRVFDVQAEKE